MFIDSRSSRHFQEVVRVLLRCRKIRPASGGRAAILDSGLQSVPVTSARQCMHPFMLPEHWMIASHFCNNVELCSGWPGVIPHGVVRARIFLKDVNEEPGQGP